MCQSPPKHEIKFHYIPLYGTIFLFFPSLSLYSITVEFLDGFNAQKQSIERSIEAVQYVIFFP